MLNNLTHFAIYTDNIARAKQFYENLFGWRFSHYGQEDFLQIKQSQDSEIPIGALQSRKYNPLDEKVIGFECSIEVSNIDAIIEKINTNNGKIVMPKTEIPYVGWLVKFLDTEGNLVCAIEYKSR